MWDLWSVRVIDPRRFLRVGHGSGARDDGRTSAEDRAGGGGGSEVKRRYQASMGGEGPGFKRSVKPIERCPVMHES